MPTDKSVILDRINIAITEKWLQPSNDISDSSENGSLKDTKELIHNTYFTHSPNAVSIEKLEQRIEALERQNDQLLYFINFLVENLPDLVGNILHTNWEKGSATSNKTEMPEFVKAPFTSRCCQENDNPCPTRREKDILELLDKGFCAKEIAHRLFISETTVVTHKKNLKEKFNARNTVELISKAQPHLAKSNSK
jgi:DNA-binding NarL/FixJ family response regulator